MLKNVLNITYYASVYTPRVKWIFFFFIQIFFAVLSEQLHGLTVSQGKVVHDKNIGRQGHLDFPLHFTDEFLCSKSQMISTAFRILHVSESLKKE